MSTEHANTEVVIIGAGPIGLETAAAFTRAGVDYLHIDAGQIGQTFFKWPRNTLFYSSPEWIAIAGIPIHSPDQFRITGEHYLSYLRMVAETLELNVRTYEKVTNISGEKGNFIVETERRGQRCSYCCASIVLATGGLDHPRMLEVPGEDLPHVSHYFDEPHRYFRQKLLIVGGRNSAVEAALRSWRAGADVTISYRRSEISEQKVLSRLHLEVGLLIEQRQLRFLPCTTPVRFGQTSTVLRRAGGEELELETDFVYCATGFRQDPSLFAAAGVDLRDSGGHPALNPQTMETNVPGVFVVGTAAGGTQVDFDEFITTGHVHVKRIMEALTGRTDVVTGNHPSRDYLLEPKDIE